MGAGLDMADPTTSPAQPMCAAYDVPVEEGAQPTTATATTGP